MNTTTWTVERIMFLFGGTLIGIFSLLTFFVDLRFVYATLFVGSMFVIFALTGYCPAAIIVAKIMKQ